MGVLDHLAQAAAVILLIELLVILLILLGIAGGLSFGLRWVRGKTDPAFAWTNGYLEKVPRYTEQASDIAMLPFVRMTGVMRYVQVAAQALRESVRRRQAAQTELDRTMAEQKTVDMRIAARPVQPPEDVTETVEPAFVV